MSDTHLFIPTGYETEPISPWFEAAANAHMYYLRSDEQPRIPTMRGIIGFAGPKEVGKDSTCELIRSALSWHLFHVRTDYLARPLYECVSAMTRIPIYVLKDRRYKQRAIDWPGAPRGLAHTTPRKLLQQTGTEMVRKHVCDSFWIDRFQDQADVYFAEHVGSTAMLVSDIRYPNEVKACDLIVELARDGISYTGEHSSEERLPQELIDVTITLDKNTNYALLAADLVDRFRHKQMAKA